MARWGGGRDHRQLAGADGTGTGWDASISHSLAPARITSVRKNASDSSAGIFLLLLLDYAEFPL